jgi:hypothetical protein
MAINGLGGFGDGRDGCVTAIMAAEISAGGYSDSLQCLRQLL